METFAALTACAVLSGLAIFQILLAAGQPLGQYAWGGNHRILPSKLRFSSLLSVVLYGLFVTIILEAAGLITLPFGLGPDKMAIRIVTAYFLLGIFVNAISRSRPERLLMTPVAAVLGLACLILAI